MKRKLISVLLATTLALSILGCGSSTEKPAATPKKEEAASTEKVESAETKKLTIWVEKVFSDEANLLVEERVKQFGAEKGVDVTCEMISATDFMTKLNATIEAGQGIPDIVSADTTKTLNYYPNIPYMDVSDLVAEINKERPYFTSGFEGTKIGDAHYYVPFCSSSGMMFIRTDVLKAKGIDKMPTTWSEVFEVAKKVSDPANDFYGIGFGCGENDDDDENTLRQWMWNEGAYLFGEDGNIVENGEKVAEILDQFASMYNDKIIPPDSITWDAGGNNTSYLAGRTAIVFNTPTLYNALRNNEENAELFANTTVLTPPMGSENAIYMGFNRGFAITKETKNADTAKELIKFLLDKTWYDEYFTYTAPVFAPIFEDEKENPVWRDDIVNAQVLMYAQNASGYYGYPVTELKDRAVASKHYFNFPVVKMFNQVATGNATAEEAIEATRRLVEDLKDQVK